jgi:RNA polymerase sigma-70 factor (ECF subfamily)
MSLEASMVKPTQTEPMAPSTRGAGGAPDDAHREDVAWIREVRGGQAEAFGHLVDRYAPPLHGLLRRFLRSDEDVEDLLQESFVRAFQALERYDATRPFYPWLRRIAVNAALNELEKRRTRREVDDPDIAMEQIHATERSDQAVQGREITEAVEEVLEEMPPGWAAVFRLRTAEELSYAEIAATLDVPVGTVMSRLARARTRLAEALAGRFGPRREESP